MDRKHGKYVMNVEPSGRQPANMCTHGQEAQRPTCWCPPSNDVTRNVSSSLSGVWVHPGILAHPECQHPEPWSTQVTGNSCGAWSLWKVFLACLLASVLTTAVGVLILSLVNRNNFPIVIQLSSNTEASAVTPQTTSTTSQTTVIWVSTGLTTTTSPETAAPTATITSSEPAGTSTAAPTGASATTTMVTTSTQLVTTTTTATTPSVPTSIATSTQPTTSPESTETSATTIDSTHPETTSASVSSETMPTAIATEILNSA